MGAVLALALLKGNGTLASFLVIAAAFRFMTAGAFDDFPAIFAEFKISQDVLGFPSCKVCGDKAYILFGSQFFILRTAVGAIRHNRYCFILFFHAIKSFFQELAVTMDVLLILVILNDAPVFARCLYDICHVPAVLFPGFSRYVASGSAGFCRMDASMPPSSLVRRRYVPSSFCMACSFSTRRRS